MFNSLNRINLIGYLTDNPKIHTKNGKEIASLKVTTYYSWGGTAITKNKRETEQHKVVVINKNLVNALKYFIKKGSKVYIKGSLRTRKWRDVFNIDRSTTEIILQNYNAELVLLDSIDSLLRNEK